MRLFNENSVVDLRISVPDQNGEQVPLKSFDEYTVKLYTTDSTQFVEFTQDDRLQLKGRNLRGLKEGVIHVDVNYSEGGFSGEASLTTEYYFQRIGKKALTECEKKEHPIHGVTQWGQIQGDVSKQKDLVDYISIQIDKNIVKMKWSQLTKDEKDEASKLIGADLAGFTNVLTEDEYQRLVDQNKVDPNVFYFTYENE